MTFVQTLPRLGLKSVEIIGKHLEAARAHRDSLPLSFDHKQFEREATLAVNLAMAGLDPKPANIRACPRYPRLKCLTRGSRSRVER